jgi:uncharacterized protein
MDNPENSVAEMAATLIAHIRPLKSVAVAFSGGVDSAVVAMAAHLALNDQAVAVTAVSPSLAASDRDSARKEAERIGIRHVEIETTEFERAEYRRNSGDRCFYCKDTLYTAATLRMGTPSAAAILNGANTDDQGDHRPGMRAAADHQVRSPLIECGFNKSAVRQLARYWNLSVAEKPASPCLASRVAYGVEVTEERVQMIEAAEAFLKALLNEDVIRVRMEAGDLARIELPLSQLHHLTDESSRNSIVQHFRALGFRAVTLDLEGFRSGNLNQMLPLVQLGGQ